MTPFTLESSMLTLRGVFYPTGYMFLMFPSEEEARKAIDALKHGGKDEAIMTLTAEDIMGPIASTVGNADTPLPSAGTEADTVRQFAELAAQGHSAIMVHAPSADETEAVMELLKDVRMSHAQKYRQLVIQDLA